MKLTQRILSFMLAMVLIFTLIPMTVAAAEANTPKEEVVYINLNYDGSVKEIYVVNIFDLDEDGRIIDYGSYESLRNMTTTEEIGYSNPVVTIDAKAGKLYYEGKLNSNVMPWNISIHYYMDGTEYSAEEIAGKSGDLKITMSITKNEDCPGNFFEGYALQTSLTLDTKKCSNIVAKGATVANVGRNKQLTYTILPGKGANIEITANVTDFEMSNISINGVRLQLNIEIDDDAIQATIDKMIDAVNELDKGAGQLNEGAKELYDGTTTLKDKVNQLYAGVGELAVGSSSLSSGLSKITSQNKELLNGAWAVFEGLCSAASTMLNSQLTQNGMSPVTITPQNYTTVLNKLLKDLNADTIYQKAYAQALATVTAEVEAQADALYAGYIDANADDIYFTYIQSQSAMIYEQVVTQIFIDQILSMGIPQDMVDVYLQMIKDKGMIDDEIAKLTDAQKNQILNGALESLTNDQKAQIRAGALASLTKDQKKQIREGYIDQLMRSSEVTNQITAAVASVNSAAVSIAGLISQLDNYKLFYNGLIEYTNAVSDAAKGANTLKINMDTLYNNVGTLNTSVGTLNDAVKSLYDGTTQLKNGTSAFTEELGASDARIEDVINSIVSSFSGSNIEIGSFVSAQNTNVNSVQFVIKTGSISITPPPAPTPTPEERLNFWQKLLRLFGLY